MHSLMLGQKGGLEPISLIRLGVTPSSTLCPEGTSSFLSLCQEIEGPAACFLSQMSFHTATLSAGNEETTTAYEHSGILWVVGKCSTFSLSRRDKGWRNLGGKTKENAAWPPHIARNYQPGPQGDSVLSWPFFLSDSWINLISGKHGALCSFKPVHRQTNTVTLISCWLSKQHDKLCAEQCWGDYCGNVM